MYISHGESSDAQMHWIGRSKVLGAGFFGLPIIIVAETPSSPYQRLGIWETLNGYLRY